MATSQVRYVRNIFGAPGPFLFPGKFQAGSTQEIRRGEFLKLSGGNFVPLSTDESMSAVVAIADCDIRPGQLAGFYNVLVPRPGDVFQCVLDASGVATPGANLYIAGSQTLTLTTGSNAFGDVCDEAACPIQKGPSDVGADQGTTVATVMRVNFTIKAANSYYAALQT